MRKLDNRELRFVDEYLIHLDPCKAAISAGYSATIAKSKAYQWVSNGKAKPHVYEVIQARIEQRSGKAGITQERILQELSRLAFLDIRKAFNADGSLKPLHDLDDDTAAAISGLEIIEVNGDGESSGLLKKIKLSDKKGALELVMRHMGMFLPKGHSDLDIELKRLEIEKRKAEIEQIRRMGVSDDSKVEMMRKLFAMLPS